jgi:hypothetical protein
MKSAGAFFFRCGGWRTIPASSVLPFGLFKGTSLRNVETDYLIWLLGQSFVRKSFRSRIDRYLPQRSASA